MLTQPDAGWSDFKLEGTSYYELSFLDDIAFDWLREAIHGLENLMPFCVKGFLEPGRFLCTVSYWNCHIVIEDDEREPLKKDRTIHECSHTSMLEFCKQLYADISSYPDDWATFMDWGQDFDPVQKRKQLDELLDRLKTLIAEREEWFGDDRCFL